MQRGVQGRRAGGRRWRWISRGLLAGLILAVGAVGYYALMFTRSSDEFRLTTVTFEGLSVLTEEEVLRASGVSSGDNILQLNRLRIEAGIETLPYVATAVVTLVFPDTMIVRVNERRPIGTLIVRNAAYEIDAEGVVLRRYASGTTLMPPLITNVGGLEVVEVGDVLKLPAFTAALEAWNAFTATPLHSEMTLSEIAARSDDEIVMYFDEIPYEIRWGRGEAAAQARRLEVLWEERDGKLDCQEYVDLRFGDDIVCK